jgi:tight adherence protein C
MLMIADTIGSFVDANSLPLAAASMFGFVFLSALAVLQVIQSRQAVRRRAIAFNPAAGPSIGVGSYGASASGATSRRPNDVEEASELLFAVEKGLSAGGDKQISKLRRELIRAGFFGKDAALWYYLARLVLACVLALLFLKLPGWFSPGSSGATTAGFTLSGAAIGLLIPVFYLRHRHSLLHRQCRTGFPNFLDLLVVCAEAGMTPRSGIERVSRELTRTHPFLGANLFLMTLELRAGRPLVEAIEGLGRRIKLDEVRSLGSLLQQTEELGTNLTTTLRVFADEMRSKRLLRAEEKAYALPVKLVLPLAFFVFPVMLVVALMPVFIRIQKAFF